MASLRYSITCPCGDIREGKRPSKLTTLTCPKCGAELLVFPTSPLVKLARSAESSKSLKSAIPSPAWPWWKPLIAGGSSLLFFLVLFTWWLLSGPTTPDAKRPPDEVEAEVRRTLREGKFAAATERLDKWLPSVPRDRRERVEQLQRQAALARDLLPEPTPDFLGHSRGLDDRAWREEFRKRYFNRTILFDALVEADEDGNPQLNHPLPEVDGPVSLDVSDVRLLRQLATRRPERLFFGLRLHDARRTPQGGWRLTFQPDEGVLMTDGDVVRSLSDWSTAELQDRIARQAIRWESLRQR